MTTPSSAPRPRFPEKQLPLVPADTDRVLERNVDPPKPAPAPPKGKK